MIKVNYNKKIKNKKYCKLAKGFKGLNSCLSRKVNEQINQKLYSSYIGRKLKKRRFTSFWIFRINSALKNINQNYSTFKGHLKRLNIFINKKMLAILAYTKLSNFYIFTKIIFIYLNILKFKTNLFYIYIKFFK
jgi:large subunit ribosomal protein L20